MLYTAMRYALLLAAAMAVSGCNDRNPLLGEWKLERTQDISYRTFEVAKITGNGRMRFEENQIVSGQQAVQVAYEVSGNSVTVEYLASGRKSTYEIIDDTMFFLEHPIMGRFKYVRVKHPKQLSIH